MRTCGGSERETMTEEREEKSDRGYSVGERERMIEKERKIRE